MIKENEIRIGNWFYHKPDVWSYRNKDEKGGEFQWTAKDWHALGECTLDLDAIEPLELTKEKLIDFGFTKQLESIFINSTGWIVRKFGQDFMWNTTPLPYVHKLQNLIYALHEQELTKIEKG